MDLFGSLKTIYESTLTEDMETLDDMTEEEVVDEANDTDDTNDDESNDDNGSDDNTDTDDTDDDDDMGMDDEEESNTDDVSDVDSEIENADSFTEKNILIKIRSVLVDLYNEQETYLNELTIKIGGLDIPELTSKFKMFRETNELLKFFIKNISNNNISSRLKAYKDYKDLYMALEAEINELLLSNNIITLNKEK